MEYTLKIDRLDEVMAAIKAMPAKATNSVRIALKKAAVEIHRTAVEKAPVGTHGTEADGSSLKVKGKNGGTLRQNIKMEDYRNGYIVKVNSPYGAYVNDGTRPHVIVPVNKRVLVFAGAEGRVFAKRVNHPGTRPQPFFSDAVDEGQKVLDAELNAVLNNLTIE